MGTERISAARAAGATILGTATSDDGSFYPFVEWPAEGEAHVEGFIEVIKEGQYGPNATMLLSDVSEGLGSREGPPFTVGDRVVVSLSSKVLEDHLDALRAAAGVDGLKVMIAFLGWGKSKAGNSYKRFQVAIWPKEEGHEPAAATELPPSKENDDDLPF